MTEASKVRRHLEEMMALGVQGPLWYLRKANGLDRAPPTVVTTGISTRAGVGGRRKRARRRAEDMAEQRWTRQRLRALGLPRTITMLDFYVIKDALR